MNSHALLRRKKKAINPHDISLNETFKIFPQFIMQGKNPLDPFLKSLAMFGLYIFAKDERSSKCRHLLRILHMSAVWISLHYWILLYLSYFVRNEATWKIFNQTLVIGTSVATYDLVLIRKKQIEAFVRYFTYDRAVPICKTQKRALLKRVHIFNAIVWIYTLFWVATFLSLPTKKNPEEHFTEFFYIHVVNKTSPNFGKILIQVNDAYLCLLTEGTLTSIVGLYIVSICAASIWFQKMGENEKGSESSLDLNQLQRLYDLLLSRIHLLDSAFSLSVLLWYFMVTLTLCIRVIAIIGDDSSDADVQGMLIIAFGLFRGTFMILIGIAFCAQSLTDTAKGAILKIEIFTVKNCVAYQELTILLRLLELKPPVVTLWNFCAIGKPFLMSCVQTMVTYVIICLQMTPAGKTLLHI
ncbi:uncharacterized protein TNIN_69641 [Trichonephila inaurata madagascariensis]|uniref:Uncharacterized protein n=1 Tax=Trichonephila inaurata madagascariensis TaxID=2747483 RepID=A0A8X7CE20_9ARAC|nr:uncharacterized protein TNIN_69641 [Trichonephila inaurata madagascariensis]